MRITPLITLFLIFLPFNATAWDYEDDQCIYTITFPEAPTIEEYCDEVCKSVLHYSYVEGIDAGLQMRIGCIAQENAYTSATKENLTQMLLHSSDVMQIQKPEIAYKDSIVKSLQVHGEGTLGLQNTLASRQIIATDGGYIVIESDLSGTLSDEGLQQYFDILQSLRFNISDN